MNARAARLASAPFRALGHAIIRASRWIQRHALGLRVPACKAREEDICRKIFHADEKIRFAETSLAYWRAELTRLEDEADKAWRVSSELSRKIDAARGIVPSGKTEQAGA